MLHLDATRALGEVELVVQDHAGNRAHTWSLQLGPDRRPTVTIDTSSPISVELLQDGRPLLIWRSPAVSATINDNAVPALEPAREPASPAEVGSVEELYLTGRHLEQYRHATRSPEPYWQEALTRDPGHAATNTAVAARRYRDGRFSEAERHLRAAVARLTALNPNPENGAAHYLLGLTLSRLGCDREAYAAFAKATWLEAWVGPGSHQMAIIDARHGRNLLALERAEAAWRARPEQLQARDLTVVLLRRLGRTDEAEHILAATLTLDPLDMWARLLAGRLDEPRGHAEAQTLLDMALENTRIGEFETALDLFDRARVADEHRPLGQTACALLADYHAAMVWDQLGEPSRAADARARARRGDRTWNFASRLDDVAALESALDVDPTDATAAALLGHWCYAVGRADDALALWRNSATLDPSDPVVWRNLAVAIYNQRHDAEAAIAACERALKLAPSDARLLFESDQLLKREGAPSDLRLRRLEQVPAAVTARDDLAVEFAHLLVTDGRPQDALAVFDGRRFQPWEGGEGQVLRAWERARLALADQALRAGDADAAVAHAEAALSTPDSLGEARHPLANPAQLLLTLGTALEAAADHERAERCWREAATARGDFNEMSPLAFSENTYFSALAARRLGEMAYADELTAGLAEYVELLARTPATIDYFATSLPALMLFDDDPQRQRDLTIELLRAQLALLAGDTVTARRHLDAVMEADPSHELAGDLVHHLELAGSLP